VSPHSSSRNQDLRPLSATRTLRPKTQHSITTTPESINKSCNHGLSTSNEEAEDAHSTSTNGWQLIRRTKRHRLLRSQPTVQLTTGYVDHSPLFSSQPAIQFTTHCSANNRHFSSLLAVQLTTRCSAHNRLFSSQPTLQLTTHSLAHNPLFSSQPAVQLTTHCSAHNQLLSSQPKFQIPEQKPKTVTIRPLKKSTALR
jgi:hypothetical protein